MRKESFVALVKRLEGESQSSPAGYKRKVGLLALLGYGYVFGVVILLLALLVGLVFFAATHGRLSAVVAKVAIVIVPVLYVVVRALIIKFPPPEGMQLKREDSPNLFSTLDEVRSRLGTPAFHKVLVTDELNAALAQVPRLGILGLQRNYVILGLPLMHALPPEEFRSVIAHEMGHLAGHHGRFGAWIYRIRDAYDTILASFGEHSGGNFLFAKFFKWYVPYFDAYSFVVVRQHEYEADRCAAEITSPETAGSALLRIKMAVTESSAAWKSEYDRVESEIEPSAAAYTSVLSRLQSPSPTSAKGIEDSLRVETFYTDTHPALKDRLRALGVEPHTPTPFVVSAAEEFLGDRAHDLAAKFAEEWRNGIEESWKERHEAAKKAAEERKDLTDKGDEATDAELWKLASNIRSFEGRAAVLPVLRRLLERNPEDAETNFRLGEALLDENDEAGVELIERSIRLDKGYASNGYRAIYSFFWERGEAERANSYLGAMDEGDEHYKAVQKELSFLVPGNDISAHSLDEKELAEVRAALELFSKQVKRAYVVKKNYEKESATYLCYVPRKRLGMARMSHEGFLKQLGKIATPGAIFDMFVLSLDGSANLAKEIEAVEGALVFGDG